MRLRLTIAYDGAGFRGWARQPGERTIEAELLAALGKLYGSVGELVVAGRTDTGVHALAKESLIHDQPAAECCPFEVDPPESETTLGRCPRLDRSGGEGDLREHVRHRRSQCEPHLVHPSNPDRNQHRHKKWERGDGN